MASSATQTPIDVAFWFLDRARAEDSYLQPQKLQRLLYLSQGYYACAYHGRKLMPATFVIHELGPIEPTVFRVFEGGRLYLSYVTPAPEVGGFLERVWRRFGGLSVERLNALVTDRPGYCKAAAAGEGEEIRFAAIVTDFRGLDEPTEVLVTSDGRRVRKWIPARSVPRRQR